MRISLIFITMLISSCAGLKREIAIGAASGVILGGTGGAIFSPVKNARDKNAYLFGVAGGLIGAGVAYLLYDAPSRPKLLNSMILDEEKKNYKEVPLFDFSPELSEIKPQVNFKPLKKYEVPIEKLPPELVGKVKKQFIIEYESEAQTLEINNRTIEISPFKAWEHFYER